MGPKRPSRRFFAAMDSFYAREGHCLVPREHVEAGYHLGFAVARYRGRKRAGRLGPNWLREIEQRYPCWVWGVRADRWQRFLTAMDSYRAAHGGADTRA
jgi:hypothetical protein